MEERRLSPRLRHALIADIVMTDAVDDYDPDDLYAPSTLWEATLELARQLRVRVVAREAAAGDVEATLRFLLPQLDDLVRNWPPQLNEGRTCQDLARETTKNMPAVELFATLMAGPPEWHREQVGPCKVDRLAANLRPLLTRRLAAELNRMLDEWVKWDVREAEQRLHEVRGRWREEQAKSPTADSRERQPFRRERGRALRERFDQYQPPGRT